MTLVESVVVIGITTFSLSVLMPSSSNASRKARSVLCVNTLKHAGRAWAMYLDDYDGYFPSGWIGNVQTSTFWNHPTALHQMAGVDEGLARIAIVLKSNPEFMMARAINMEYI